MAAKFDELKDLDMKILRIKRFGGAVLGAMVLFVILLVNFGCEPRTQTERQNVDVPIQTGRSVDDVIAVLGDPRGRVSSGDHVTLFYTEGPYSFQSGKLVSFPDQLNRKPSTGAKNKWGVFSSDDDQVVDPMHRHLLTKGQVTVVSFVMAAEDHPAMLKHASQLRDLVEKYDATLRYVRMAHCRDPKFQEYIVPKLPAVRVFNAQGEMVGGTVETLMHNPIRRVERLIKRAKRKWLFF